MLLSLDQVSMQQSHLFIDGRPCIAAVSVANKCSGSGSASCLLRPPLLLHLQASELQREPKQARGAAELQAAMQQSERSNGDTIDLT